MTSRQEGADPMTAHALPRDLVGYGEHPPSFRWPGESRVAVSLVLNIEDGAERSTARGDDADDRGAHWTPHPVIAGQRNPALESAFEYGARAGIWRVLRTLRRWDARATAFCCSVALEANPIAAAAIVRDGHEIADHGCLWEPHTDLPPAEESERMARSIAGITRITGTAPTTWYSRDGITTHSRDAMIAHGFSYDSNSFNDDLPHPAPDGLPLPVLPYAGDTNDSGLFTQYPTAGAFRAFLIGALDTLLEEDRTSVLSVGLHPRIIGRPAYISALNGFLAHARETNAWVATRADIVDAWRSATG